MKGEWCYWINAFTPKECEDIIALAKPLPPIEATIGVESKVDTSFRKSAIKWINQEVNPEFSWVHDRFWKCLLKINRDWFNFNITTLPPLQFTEYDESYLGEYKSHQDIYWISDNPNQRKISLILQLSNENNYQGGRLVIEKVAIPPSEEEYSTMRKIGTIIAFPSFVYHRLEPVTKGKRYSLVAWFEGPKFQ